MYDSKLLKLTNPPRKKAVLDKDFFKCRCTDNHKCKACMDWDDYTAVKDNEWWSGQ